MKTDFSFQAKPHRAHGFTLIEIGVALAVLGVLSAILLSVLSKSRAGANRVTCDTHLKAIALALDAFKQEHAYFPPALETLQTDKYIPDANVLGCPSDPRDPPTYAEFYVLRGPRDHSELPLLICPFHGEHKNGVQAFIGRYTMQFQTSPARLTAAMGANVQHPGKAPVSATVGMALHGADRLTTYGGGSATITFADQSQAIIGQNTDLTVLQSFLEGQTKGALYTLVRQTLGTVEYHVHHGSKFDVVTPTATAGALGTAFEIRVSPKQATWLRVTQGEVRFNTIAGRMSNSSNISASNEWVSAAAPSGGLGPGPKPQQEPGAPPF